jgi:hypothetical protein
MYVNFKYANVKFSSHGSGKTKEEVVGGGGEGSEQLEPDNSTPYSPILLL